MGTHLRKKLANASNVAILQLNSSVNPVAVNCFMSVLLEKEYKIYLNHLNEFVRHHHNEFVLIKDGQVVDFFSSYEEALQTGLKRFGNVAFFIKEVRKKQERHFLHQSIQSL